MAPKNMERTVITNPTIKVMALAITPILMNIKPIIALIAPKPKRNNKPIIKPPIIPESAPPIIPPFSSILA